MNSTRGTVILELQRQVQRGNDLWHAVKMISISVPGPTGRRGHSLKRSWAWDGPGFNLPELVFTSAFLLLSTPGVLVQ